MGKTIKIEKPRQKFCLKYLGNVTKHYLARSRFRYYNTVLVSGRLQKEKTVFTSRELRVITAPTPFFKSTR